MLASRLGSKKNGMASLQAGGRGGRGKGEGPSFAGQEHCIGAGRSLKGGASLLPVPLNVKDAVDSVLEPLVGQVINSNKKGSSFNFASLKQH